MAGKKIFTDHEYQTSAHLVTPKVHSVPNISNHAGVLGQLAASGNNLYFHDGSNWFALIESNYAGALTGRPEFDPASGNVPFTVGSGHNAKVDNLNADLLDGYDTSATATANRIPVYGTGGILPVSTPTADGHAATKAYVDDLVQGLDIKASVAAASTANLTLSGTQTVDGVSLSAGNRVLVKDQSTASQNGIYIVASGSWALAEDSDAGSLSEGAYVFVEAGTANNNTGWTYTDSASYTWAKFSGAGQLNAGDGLVKSGDTLSANVAAPISIVSDQITIADGAITGAKLANNTVTSTQLADSIQVSDLAISGDSSYMLTVDRTSSSGTWAAFGNSTTGSAGDNGLIVGVGSDESAYFWHKENQKIHIGTNGASAIDVEADNDVKVFNDLGIATSPSHRFHVKDNTDTGNGGIAIERSSTGDKGFLNMRGGRLGLVTESALPIKFYTDNTSRLEIDGSTGDVKVVGKLGVNTSPISLATASINGTLQATFGHFTGWAGNGDTGTGLGVDVGVSGGRGYVMAYNRTSSSYGDLRFVAAGGNTGLTLLSASGDVGCNTMSPSTKFHVYDSTSNTTYAARTSVIDTLTVETHNTGQTPYNGFGQGIVFRGATYNNTSTRTLGRIAHVIRDDSSATTTGTAIRFQTQDDPGTTNAPVTQMEVGTDVEITNKLGIGVSPDTALSIQGPTNLKAKIKLTNTNPSTDNVWSIHANYNDQSLRFLGDSNLVLGMYDDGWLKVGANQKDFARQSNFDYSNGSYKVLQLGTCGSQSGIAIGVDISNTTTSQFGGNEIIFPNQVEVISTNKDNNGFLGIWATDNNNKLRIGNYRFNLLNDTPGITIDLSSASNSGQVTLGNLPTSTADNSLIVENSGLLKKRTANSGIWTTNLGANRFLVSDNSGVLTSDSRLVHLGGRVSFTGSIDGTANLKVDLVSDAITTNQTSYEKAFYASGLNGYNISSGVTDSGYRIAVDASAFVSDSTFAGTLAKQKAVWARNGANVSSSGSTITDSYGVYIESLTNSNTTISNLWGLYQSSSNARNYFAGNVGIGVTPTTDFTVKGRFTYDDSTRLLTIVNSTNTGGINLSGGNSRIYFTNRRAIEGNTDGSNLTIGEGYTNTTISGYTTLGSLPASTTDTNVIVESSGFLKKRALNNVAFSGFGSGTVGKIPLWSGNTTTLSDSVITQSSSGTLSVAGNTMIKAGALLGIENASETNSAYISNVGGTGVSKLNIADTLYVNEGGNCGIGTDDPDALVHISGASTGTQTYGLFSTGSADGDQNLHIQSSSSRNHMALQVKTGAGAVDDLSLNPDGGNVGISTADPGLKLDVQATSAQANLGVKRTDGSWATLYGGSSFSGLVFDNSGYFKIAPGPTTNRTDTSGSGLIIDDSGNVGVSTDSPQTKLHLNGGATSLPIIRLQRDDTSVQPDDLIGGFENYSNDADGSFISSYVKGYATETYGRKGYLTFGTAGTNVTDATEKMRLSASGNLGINCTPNENYKLDVNGDASFGGAATKLITYSDASYSGIYNGSELGSDEAIYFGAGATYFLNNGASSLTINASAQLLISDGSVAAPSLSFINDTNTGMFRAGADHLQLVAGGTGRLKVTADVSIIGATDLLVTGANRRLSFTSGTGTVRTTTAADLYLATNLTNRVQVTSGGAVKATRDGGSNLIQVARIHDGSLTGNGTATSFTITHNLETGKPIAVVIDDDSGAYVEAQIVVASDNAISVTFNNPPASGKVYRVPVTG